ncbi:hypothetical protein [Mesorhizobium sp.]|uniref:hypothetical protein n=1 Tax=Mesorhizobium sp. TaxID=1871066 RepID=UPI00338D7D4D
MAYALMFDVEALHSAVRGVFIGTPILLYERGVILRRWRNVIRQAATPVFVVATIATYVLMILIGNAAAGTALHHLLGYMSTAREAMVMSESGLLYSLGVSTLVAFVLRLRDLIGPSLFTSLLLGRYHRPIKEERIFLFLDVSGSTHFADRYGDLRPRPTSDRYSTHLRLLFVAPRALLTTTSGIWRWSPGPWIAACGTPRVFVASSTSRRS